MLIKVSFFVFDNFVTVEPKIFVLYMIIAVFCTICRTKLKH